MAMNRKLWLLPVLLLVSFNLAEAQQPKKSPPIGYISGTGDASNQGAYVDALRQGLRKLGYVDGKNIETLFISSRQSLFKNSISFLLVS